MTKVLILLVFVCFTIVLADDKTHVYNAPVKIIPPKTAITLFDVWPTVDKILKANYWYYLRGANNIYEASVDSPLKYLFFTIYRNIVGTFLVITTWTKGTQQAKVNTFVRLGNGYEEGSGQNYPPVNIDPFIVTLALGPD